MKRKILACQIGVCVCIACAAFIGKHTDSKTLSSYYDRAHELVMHQITAEELVDAKDKAISVMKGTPSKLVSTVEKVSSQSKYGEPIDEKSKEDVQSVHAVAGGVVAQSGHTESLGMFVKIKHEGAVSVYGHMKTINVVEGERIQKGEIIGAYDKTSEKEFYFQLKEDV